MFNIVKIAATVIGGPLGGVVGSIFEQIAGLGKGGGAQDPTKIFEQALQSLSQFTGQGASGAVSPTPLPYSNPANAGNQPASFEAQRDQINQLLSQIAKLLEQMSGQSAGAAGGVSGGGASYGGGLPAGINNPTAPAGSFGPSGSSAPGGASGLDSMVDSVGSSIDKMMGDAEGLMKSDKQSDQLKGQMMMQKAMRLFEMISKLLEQRSQMASKAIQAIK